MTLVESLTRGLALLTPCKCAAGRFLALLVAAWGVSGATAQTSLEVPIDTQVRTVSYTYTSARLLKTETTEPQGTTDLKLATEYEYEAVNGNRTKATVTGWNGVASQARSASIGWDGSGRFPVKTTNAKLQVEQTKDYDARFGTVTRTTDANGVTTRWDYDAFGRKIKELRGYASATANNYTDYTQWQYERCADKAGGCLTVGGYVPVHVITATVWSSTDKQLAPAVKTYFDQHDREVRTEAEALVGNVVKQVYKDTTYDKQGNVLGVSLPYFAGDVPQWTFADHDDLGRKIKETGPSGIVTTTTYTALSTVVQVFATEGVRSKTIKHDAAGRTIQVIDAKANPTWFIQDANGNLTHTIDTYGNTTVSTYDLRGRKIGMVDPDMGSWSYAYNAFGELTAQTDAKRQSSQLKYDELGRLVKRTEPDLTTEWGYDSATNGVGKLARTYTDSSYCRTPSYDTLGRLSETAVGFGPSACTAPSSSFKSSTTYDAAGRVETSVFPTGVTLKYGYNDTLGFLEKVLNQTGGTAGTVYWQWQEGDALGRVTKYLTGNNVATLKTYDAKTTWLDSIYAGTAGNPAMGDVQWAGYKYDSIGNLAQRSDRFALPNLLEKVEHDELGRLTGYARYDSTGASELAGTRVTQTYDPLGNLKTKSDIGTYYYNPSGAGSVRPHAVAEVRGALNASYAYNDANGNMTGGAGRSFAYTSYNMVREVGNQRTCQRFIYQSEHQRIQQSIYSTACAYASEGNRIAQTLYLHPDAANGLSFEQETKGGATRYKHYINAGGMVVGMLTTESASVSSNIAGTMAYFHYDHLGSVVAISNAAGGVIERRSFDPWGRARQTDGTPGDGELPNGDGSSGASAAATDRGFTLHEHLEDLGLIHMNGRVYDFALGRFTSADPNVPSPEDMQSYNRYAYVMNRPLDSVDPTGFVNTDLNCYLCLGSGDWNYGFGGPALYINGPGLGGSASARFSGQLSNGFTASSIESGGIPSERSYNRGIDYSLNLPSGVGSLSYQPSRFAPHLTPGDAWDYTKAQGGGVVSGFASFFTGIWSAGSSPIETSSKIGSFLSSPGDAIESSARAMQSRTGEALRAARRGEYTSAGQLHGELIGQSAAGSSIGLLGLRLGSLFDSGKVASGAIQFGSKTDAFLANAARATQPVGMLDIAVHGTATTVQIGDQVVNHRVLAALIERNSQFTRQPIRLLSCETGCLPNGFAANLANRLGVTVHAPNDIIWAFPKGQLTVGAAPFASTGSFVKFTAGGYRP